MADINKDSITTENRKDQGGINPLLHGRLPIWTGIERFDPSKPGEILTEVNEALSIHAINVMDEDYLYWYRRGITPVQNRTKEIRPEINNKINVNYAEEIVSFKNGYFITGPCTYIARDKGEDLTEDIKKLNEFLFRSGKTNADNKVVDWFHTVGKGALFIRANDDAKKPFEVFALNPLSTFVAKSLAPGNRPVYGGYTVKQGDDIILSLWDDSNVYTIKGTKASKMPQMHIDVIFTATEITDIRPNPLGAVPIIEYYYNSVQMSAFEAALPLIDATSFLQSDRLDGVDQAVQSLLVFYNCELDDTENENGEKTTPEMVRKSGALFLKSVGENRADLKEIVTNLDQTQTQVFMDNLREQILTISAMPFTSVSRGYSNAASGQAQLARDGWYQADTAARNCEDLFLESNAYFEEIMLKILRDKGILDIDPASIKLQFMRNETANVQSKAQAFQTLVASGFAPILAAAKSGVSSDPVADMKTSEPYLKMIWGDPNKVDAEEEVKDGEGEAEIIEQTVPSSSTGGDI